MQEPSSVVWRLCFHDNRLNQTGGKAGGRAEEGRRGGRADRAGGAGKEIELGGMLQHISTVLS